MKISLIKTQFGTEIQEMDLPDDMLKDAIANPSEEFVKNDILWKFTTYKDYVRSNENALMRYALELDFDNNMTIEQFKSKYFNLKFYLYTTPSHTPEKNKFRVILPLSAPELFSELNENQTKRMALRKFFIGVDSSSFSNFHNVPMIPTNPDVSYYYHFNEGRLFSWRSIQSFVVAETLKAQIPQKKEKVEKKSQLYIDKVITNLKIEAVNLDFSKNGNNGKVLDRFGQPQGTDYFMFRIAKALINNCGVTNNEALNLFILHFSPSNQKIKEMQHKIKEVSK